MSQSLVPHPVTAGADCFALSMLPASQSVDIRAISEDTAARCLRRAGAGIVNGLVSGSPLASSAGLDFL